MKFVLAICTIALVAQLSFAASIRRFKRDQPTFYEMKKTISFALSSAIGDIIKELPDTEEYYKYIQQFEDILRVFNTKDESVSCNYKLDNFFIKFGEIFKQMRRNDRDVSQKIEHSIISKSGYRFDEQKYDEAVANMVEPNSTELLEVC